MKDKFLHIFINLINRKHDKFFGIKKQLLTKDNHHCRDIKLSEKSMNLFMSVEYGNKKYFRELYYSSVFRELEKKLIKSVNNNNNNFIIIYLQDEGVWSEFLRHLIQKYNLNHIYFVNVQHGFLMKNEPSLFRNKIINFINSIYNLLFGFPKFGIGPFNGLFNYYLLFHEELCSEVPNASKAIHCPNLINRSSIDSYQLETSNTTVIQKSVLIALQHNPLFGFYSITFEQSLKTLIPLIESLKERFGYDI